MIASGFGASFVPGGTTPSCDLPRQDSFTHRVPPGSNLPLYLAIHSFGTWCGAWVAPGAKYMKNGLSGVSDFWNCIQPIALSVMSVMKL